jgi:hypothetical protein
MVCTDAGHGARAQLGDERARRDLRAHEPAVEPRRPAVQERRQPAVVRRVAEPRQRPLAPGGELDHRRGERVARERDVLAVEVAAVQHRAVGVVGALGEHQRVVGGAVELRLDHAGVEAEHVERRAQLLRHAPHGVRVLRRLGGAEQPGGLDRGRRGAAAAAPTA